MAARSDADLMFRALRLAARGWGRVHPNPLVGALVIDAEGRVLGEGWHEQYGGPHAEVMALAAAAEAARGATLFVTLEPCRHYGQTPPCTSAILAAGIRRVVFAARDPNPGARGGADILRAAGVQVDAGFLEPQARRQNAAFFHWHERQQPYVALKLAMTIDGAIALRDHPRVLVTGEVARGEANRLRAGFDAVLVGIGTILADDPLLTVRDHPVRIQPRRVILDSDALLPLTSRVLQAEPAEVLVCCAPDADPARVAALRHAGAVVEPVARQFAAVSGGREAPDPPAPDPGREISSGAHGLDTRAVIARLGELGMRSIFCEGGARLAGALLQADLVERQYLFIAPRRFGPAGVRPLESLPPTADGAWDVASSRKYGADALLVLERERSGDVHGDR